MSAKIDALSRRVINPRRGEALLNRRRSTAAHLFLCLSMATGVVEIGIPLIAWRAGAGIEGIVALGLAYQLGTLLSRVRAIGQRLSFVTLVGTGSTMTYAVWRGSFALLFVGALTTSVMLQASRKYALSMAPPVSTASKRVCRIGGFVIAGFVNGPSLAVIAVAVSIAILAIPLRAPAHERVQSGVTFSRAVMLLHQMHYFCYAYVLLWLLIEPDHSLLPVIGPMFAAGWVSYTATPLLLGRLPARAVVVVGHALTAGILVVMVLVHGPVPHLVLWILTGFGGGTVFGIRRICKAAGDTEDTVDLWEEVGHVGGATVGLLLAIVDPLLAFIGAAVFACSVAAMISLVPYPRRTSSARS